MTTPPNLVFDESYYVADALSFLHGGAERSWVHPPLGKWIIAGGMRLFGNNPLGWRVWSFVFGCAVVVLTYLVALRLLRSWPWATLATALVAVDGLQIVQSRVAMLDIFQSAFLLASVLLIVIHVDRSPGEGSVTDTWRSRPLQAAGVLMGLALATKWSTVPAIIVAGAVVVAASPSPRRAVGSVAAVLGLVPLLVYAVSYAGFWVEEGLAPGRWLRLQLSMLNYHRHADTGHSYASLPLWWPLLRRPVVYFFELRRGVVQEVVALGNPMLWWGFLLSIPVLVRSWLRAGDRAADVVMLAVVALYLPWLVVWRTTFLFYLTPLVPFMAVGVSWALRMVWTSPLPGAVRRSAVAVFVVATGAAAAALLPVWVGMPIGARHWARIMLFKSWI